MSDRERTWEEAVPHAPLIVGAVAVAAALLAGAPLFVIPIAFLIGVAYHFLWRGGTETVRRAAEWLLRR